MEELEDRLQVPRRAAAPDPLGQLVDERSNARDLAGPRLPQLGPAEVAEAHLADDLAGASRREMNLVAGERVAAWAPPADQHLVVLEVRRLEQHDRAVRQRPARDADVLELRLARDGARRRRFRHERL